MPSPIVPMMSSLIESLPPLEKQRDYETNQRHAVEKEASKEGFESIDAMLEMQFERIHGQY